MTEESGEEKFETIQDEEIEAVTALLRDLDMSAASAPRYPVGMSPERYYFVSFRIMQQQSGNLFASVDAVFSHEWQAFGEEDFSLLMRDCSFEKTWDDGVVQDIYKRTREAAIDPSSLVSDSQAVMRAGGAIPARLFHHVDLVAEAAHLCPKTGADCKVETWIYAASAVLGLSPTDQVPLLKSLCGSLSPQKIHDEEDKPSTMHNTGLNRSPCNLLLMMEQRYLFDLSSCVVAVPIMKVPDAKEWTGKPYRVIVLCDNEKRGKATYQEVAQRVGLSTTNAKPATKDDIDVSVTLLTQVLKFSAFALENKPPPPSRRGASLWEKYRGQLEAYRSLYASLMGESRNDTKNKVMVPTVKELINKRVAVIDLDALNQGNSNIIFPDPLLLTFKSSVNWTRKFGFQMMAEAEAIDGFAQRREQDSLLGKSISLGSNCDDGSHSYSGN